MTTVGDILTNARNRKKLTLEQAEKATKIRRKFLEALEKNEFSKLPPGTFTKGFIKNYAAFLGLSVDDTLAFYRRQVNEEKISTLPVKNPAPPTPKSPFSSLSFTGVGVMILVILFFVYLVYSYLSFAGSPALALDTPAKNAVVNTDEIEVTGKTDPDATLMINNQAVSINENGTFSTKIDLTPGLNTITIIASNKFHRQTTITRNLRLEK
ncbi:helix-turn-helix domain-containing protein [Patescibacteria group bacterium]|nr:helix-turn-helix domain-containing protein [Patescibacteria group bacterium]